MIQNLNTALQLDWKAVVFGILVLLVVLKDVLDLLADWKKRFRIKFGYEEEKDEVEKRISKLERHDKDQYDKIDEMFELIKKINDRTLKESIERCRFEILDMASALGSGRKYTKEQYNHVIATHNRYTELLEENGMTNGQTDASMEIIMESYKERLKEGF